MMHPAADDPLASDQPVVTSGDVPEHPDPPPDDAGLGTPPPPGRLSQEHPLDPSVQHLLAHKTRRASAAPAVKRAAIYIRVSTEEQAEEGYSLAAQERACRLYAELQGWHVAAVYADEGVSAFRDQIAERPALRQLLDAVDHGSIQAVIVHKLDRFFRRVRLLIEVVERFEQQAVQFVSCSEQIDFATPVGRMILTNLGAFAEFYSRNLATEVAKGMREKAQQGGWVGPIPIGYEKGADGRLVPSADAPIVRLIFDLYASRQHSYCSIADELNRRGWQTHDMQTGRRGRFGRESIRTILGNPAYIGLVSSGGIHYR